MNSNLRGDATFRDLLAANSWGLARAGVRERINYYRPLQMMTYRVIAEIFGFDARAFHAVSLAFHVIAVLLAFALFYTWTSSTGVAFASAALFAVHPIHSEAVDWIAALPDIGCTTSLLVAFLLFVIARMRWEIKAVFQQITTTYLYSLSCFILSRVCCGPAMAINCNRFPAHRHGLRFLFGYRCRSASPDLRGAKDFSSLLVHFGCLLSAPCASARFHRCHPARLGSKPLGIRPHRAQSDLTILGEIAAPSPPQCLLRVHSRADASGSTGHCSHSVPDSRS